MVLRCVVLPLFLAFQVSFAAQVQQPPENADVQTSLDECQTIHMTLAARDRQRANGDVPENDDFAAAGGACDQLERVVAGSDPAKIKSAMAALRPIMARLGSPPATPQEQLAALQKATSGASGETLFDALPDLAKRAFNAGQPDQAKSYANQLLKMAPQFPKSWNYGNAIFYGNFILGLVALEQGKVEAAGQYLLASSKTPGSPQLDSFGPNMTLAKQLLEKGHSRDVVLQYLENCKKFWDSHLSKLDNWIATVKSGGIPNFGANLDY